MTDSLDRRLTAVTPNMIETTIRQQAHDAQTRGLDAARMAVALCDQAGIGPHDPDRAQAYPLILARLKATVERTPGMRYVTGMT